MKDHIGRGNFKPSSVLCSLYSELLFNINKLLYICLFILQDDEPAKPKEAVKRKAEPAAEEEDDEPIVKKSAADFANKSFDSPRGMLINNLVCLGTKLCT